MKPTSLHAPYPTSASITYNLNATEANNVITPSATVLGKVTYSDYTSGSQSNNGVKITIDLFAPYSGDRIDEFAFNSSNISTSGWNFAVAGNNNILYDVDPNKIKIDSYSGKFDISLTDYGPLGQEPITIYVTKSSTDLDPGTFNVADSNGKIFNAALVDLNCDPAVWVVSTAVPEPVSVSLLGTGMLALGLIRRRRSIPTLGIC